MTAARSAIEALERNGIDAVNISLAGPAALDAHSASEHRGEEGSSRATRFVSARVVAGGVIGSIVGGVVGVVAAFLAGGDAGVVALGAIAGVLALGAMGAFAGGVLALPLTDSWELTFEPVSAGEVIVDVHSDAPGIIDRAAAILEQSEPRSIARDRGARRSSVA